MLHRLWQQLVRFYRLFLSRMYCSTVEFYTIRQLSVRCIGLLLSACQNHCGVFCRRFRLVGLYFTMVLSQALQQWSRAAILRLSQYRWQPDVSLQESVSRFGLHRPGRR